MSTPVAEPVAEAPARRGVDAIYYELDAEESVFYKQQTGITDDEELKKHIIGVAERAWAIHPYPCIERFHFTKLKISRLPAYTHFLKVARGRPDALFLDIGCCFGNDIRKVIADGVPARNVIASDLRSEFWDAGHELFRSTPSSFPVPFLGGDAFDPSFLSADLPIATVPPPGPAPELSQGVKTLTELGGRLALVHASSFFHLFDEAHQARLARLLGGLMSPTPGSTILGSHVSMVQKGLRPSYSHGRQMFCHNPESWRELWEGVFGKGHVEVKAELKNHKMKGLAEGSTKIMEWSVTRV